LAFEPSREAYPTARPWNHSSNAPDRQDCRCGAGLCSALFGGRGCRSASRRMVAGQGYGFAHPLDRQWRAVRGKRNHNHGHSGIPIRRAGAASFAREHERQAGAPGPN